jgi:hypothetical protein
MKFKNFSFSYNTSSSLCVVFENFCNGKKHTKTFLSLSLSLCLAKLALSVGEREMNLNVTF